MKPAHEKDLHVRPPRIKIDTKKCRACWKCLDTCPHHVIGRINLPWHKHARIIREESCTACLKCLNVCSNNAIVVVKNQKP